MNTWADIKAAFDDITRDSSRVFFPADTVVRWANRGLEGLCDEARYIDYALVSNSSTTSPNTYAVSDGGYDVFRVEYDGEALLPITRDHLRSCMRDLTTQTGLPRFYYLDQMDANPDYLYVGLYPTPTSALVNGVRIWYHSYPTAVSDAAPATEIAVPDWAVGGVLFYMLSRAYEADTKVQSFDKSAMYGMLYDDIKERLVVRSRDRQPKVWVFGAPGQPSASVLNRLPDRIPAP